MMMHIFSGKKVRGMGDRNGVFVLPQTDDLTICVEYCGVISEENYKHTLTPMVRERVERNGYFHILVRYAGFIGWEKDAADKNFSDLSSFGKYARKMAYVHPPEHKILLMKFMDPVLGGKVRFFEEKDFNKAVEWVKS